jgi:hypothetical protein
MIEQENFNNAIRQNDIRMITFLLKLKEVEVAKDDNWAIRYAAEYGYQEIFELLLNDSRTDPSDHFNWAIRLASKNEHINIVKQLIEDSRVDPSYRGNWAIMAADFVHNKEIIEILWSNTKVKNTLQKNQPKLFNKLKITDKITHF